MSKNPYFAHLPTWRNRQDLAYALDNLPKILETMNTSASTMATFPYPPPTPLNPTLSSSLSSSSSPPSPTTTTTSSSSTSSSSTVLPSSPSSISASPYSRSSSPSLSIIKANSAAFRERFMMDLAKECQRSRSPAFSSSTSSTTSRRINSTDSSHLFQGHNSSSSSLSSYSSSSSTTVTSCAAASPYNLQFSTRAKAMAFLIEILQSLQKEPCGCDLTKGCYCGQDGIEDHEGKSPCYVCGEWFPDRRDMNQQGSETSVGHSQARAWHEQGSLRHHVAESRVKKWLDSVWRPPMTPATTPEQEAVRQFVTRTNTPNCGTSTNQNCYATSGDNGQLEEVAREDLGQRHDQSAQYQQPSPRRVVALSPERPWSVHDIELEARSKSRSRRNSSSSPYLPPSPMPYCSSPLQLPQQLPQQPQQQQQQDRCAFGPGYNYHLNSGSCGVTASPMPRYSTPPIQPSYHQPQPQYHPWAPTALVIDHSLPRTHYPTPPPLPPAPHHPSLTSQHQTRTRTQSCSDSQEPNYVISACPMFTPPTPRPSSSNSITRNRTKKPVRASTANSTFAIPQEILDPSYRSPTFRIKSWNPPGSSTRPASAPMPTALDGWSKPEVPKESSEPAVKTSTVKCPQPVQQQDIDNIATDANEMTPGEETAPAQQMTQTPVFQFNFTSQRFMAAVQASLEKQAAPAASTLSAKDDNITASLTSSSLTTVQTAAAKMASGTESEVLVDEDEDAQKVMMSAVTVALTESTTTAATREDETAETKAVTEENASDLVSRLSSAVSAADLIQKSAPMSPPTPGTPNTTAVTTGVATAPVPKKKRNFFTRTAPSSSASTSAPTSPKSPPGAAAVEASKRTIRRAMSWSSIQKLMRKMTRTNDIRHRCHEPEGCMSNDPEQQNVYM
ncbi:hypothetical protein BGZ51_005747 [Haplosporangium sp. Z 767]|nr:hypothetical protein BGZ51_005747 [Haplosporangium sp. Z 767]